VYVELKESKINTSFSLNVNQNVLGEKNRRSTTNYFNWVLF